VPLLEPPQAPLQGGHRLLGDATALR